MLVDRIKHLISVDVPEGLDGSQLDARLKEWDGSRTLCLAFKRGAAAVTLYVEVSGSDVSVWTSWLVYWGRDPSVPVQFAKLLADVNSFVDDIRYEARAEKSFEDIGREARTES